MAPSAEFRCEAAHLRNFFRESAVALPGPLHRVAMPKGPGESGCYSGASPSIVITRMWMAAMFAHERASGSSSNLRREG